MDTRAVSRSGTRGEIEPRSDGLGFASEPPIGGRFVQREGVDWHFMLALFLRVLAAIWMGKALMSWGALVGLGERPFSSLPESERTALVAFALVQTAVTVGLWLVTGWGRLVFALLVVAEIAVPFALESPPLPAWALAGEGAAVAVLIALVLLERRGG